MSPLTSKQRAAMRGEANRLQPIVHVGQQGLTSTIINSLDDALRTRELVKVQLGRQVEVKVKDVAQALALATSAEIVQVIGRTATLYRENPELPHRADQPPPWQR